MSTKLYVGTRSPASTQDAIARAPERDSRRAPSASVVTDGEKGGAPSRGRRVIRDPALEPVPIVTREKRGVDRVVEHLRRLDESADAIHGNKSQGAREGALDGFRAGRVKVLVATDIAARGIDGRGITHVINFDLPNVPDSFAGRGRQSGRRRAARFSRSPTWAGS